MKTAENPRRLEPRLIAAAALGAGLFVAGLLLSPKRAWAALLLANFYFLGLSLFAPVFLAIQRLTSSTWHKPLRRLVCAMNSYFPAGAAVSAVLLLGTRRLYPWAAPDAVQDAYARAHAVFFNAPFFALRCAAYLAAWHFAGRRLVREDGHSKRPAAVFLLLFALTFSLASVDWLMSLVPRWTSTLFPWYVFSGTLVAGFAAAAALLVLSRRHGFFGDVPESALHDLGKFVFAFSFFWGYLWLSQFLLIWYSNIPEETSFYQAQWTPPWAWLFWANVIINFVAPFVLLLGASAKKNERLLLAAGLIILLGHWLDLALLIEPPVLGGAPAFGWIELGTFLGVAALYLRGFAVALEASAIPDGIVAPSSSGLANI